MECRAFLLIAIAMLTCTLAAAAPGPRETDDRRHVSADRAVAAIRKEAMAAWRESRALPRNRADFAQAHGLRVDRADLIYALGEPHHRSATFDAYVRWQLLSFADQRTFDDLPPAHYVRLAMNLPRLARPRRAVTPAGLVEPTLDVVSEGTAVDIQAVVPAGDPRYVTLTMQTSHASIVRFRQVSQAMDRELDAARRPLPADPAMVLRFREMLIDRLPVAQGARLLALVCDMHDRLEAGHRSAASRAAALRVHLEQVEGPLRLDPSVAEALSRIRTRLTRLDWPDHPADGETAAQRPTQDKPGDTASRGDRSALRTARDEAIAALHEVLGRSSIAATP